MSTSDRAKLSLNPDDQVEGGLADDLDATIGRARYVMFDYGGKSEGGASLAIHCHLVPPEGDPLDQYYSAGKGFVPNEEDEGRSAVAVDAEAASRGLSKSSNAAVFMRELVNAGFPKDKLGSDVSVLDGIKAHWNQVAQPERKGLAADPKRATRGPRTLLVPTKILHLPWEKSSGKTATKAKAVASLTENGAVRDETKALLKELLAKHGGTLDRSRLPILAFKAVPKSNSNKNAIVDLIPTEELLTLQDGWLFDVSTGEVVLV